jgi:hypothetical protein
MHELDPLAADGGQAGEVAAPLRLVDAGVGEA